MLGPVLVPNRFDIHNDGMTANEVEAACHHYNSNHFGSCDINHVLDVTCAKIVESYILEVDCTINGQELTAGTWMAKVQIDNTNAGDVIWNALVEGDLNGYSPEGMVSEHQIKED
tara:strand:- start:311 stop:655 length:345 start_codon:yes stop_codon:yes gene_type:complete